MQKPLTLTTLQETRKQALRGAVHTLVGEHYLPELAFRDFEIFGGPGSGKSTLVNNLLLYCTSHKKLEGSGLVSKYLPALPPAQAQELQDRLAQGHLVDDTLILSWYWTEVDELRNGSCKGIYHLGLPRTPKQATTMKDRGVQFTHCVFLEVSPQQAVSRMYERAIHDLLVQGTCRVDVESSLQRIREYDRHCARIRPILESMSVAAHSLATSTTPSVSAFNYFALTCGKTTPFHVASARNELEAIDNSIAQYQQERLRSESKHWPAVKSQVEALEQKLKHTVI